jgi:hypothetical protein
MSLPKIPPICVVAKKRTAECPFARTTYAQEIRGFQTIISECAGRTSRGLLRGDPNVYARRSTESGSQDLGSQDLLILSIEVVLRFPLSLHKKHFALHNSLNCVAANFRQQRWLKRLSPVSRFHWTTSNRVKEGTRMRVQPALQESCLPVSAWCWRPRIKIDRIEGCKNVASR